MGTGTPLRSKILKDMMYLSFKIIEEKKDYLDSINVFPVPDGDTGINMYLTLKSVCNQLDKVKLVNKNTVCQAIIDGSFIGAKGNSGTILSQYLNGFANSLKNSREITPISFAEALKKGTEKAYDSVFNPKEGTMLTAFKKVSEKAQVVLDLPWSEFMHELFKTAQQATLETREMLEALKKGGVVDSGAMGFVYIFQGWTVTIEEAVNHNQHEETLISGLEGLKSHIDLQEVTNDTKFRYCTEALIEISQDFNNNVKDHFKAFGEYLMITRDNSLLKLHIHTDEPSKVLNEFANFGRVKSIKVDDMVSQAVLSD